ncbi:tRNA uridine-5-carboxymethylaminomethyl(34) synthesis GTPase MnmE [Agrobacterium sp. SORGH_AS 787]|uniref:tRNA uridine-5-carboxymethylaminomethyl(34) synthesis GTPase MnmE n=1 Tax=Agrobacterium sp. SORGH_AS 787 TaxID=3041775 RepID=UPI00277DE068|nr:tRNA modification GTPase [Rhizobium sp. SORGH_AS_0787]
MSQSTDTIYALSSGSLPAGVAIIRISGSKAVEALRSLVGDNLPSPRQASLKTIRHRNGDVVDQALVLQFLSPHSFTGEDCVELHVHGSRAVVSAIFQLLESMPGLRHAEAGEFSRRAFDNGKMDLVEVEGLADLLQAETEMQRRLAVEQSSGHLSSLYDGWASQLTRCRALIEAELDFADEDDVPDSVATQVWKTVGDLESELARHLADGQGSEIIRDGFNVALVGAPNVGKSSLMNALSGRDVAIVTDIAGTTRDVLSVDLDIEGYLVTLFDTAGLRNATDVVEQEGIKRAERTAEAADLVLLLQDTDSEPEQVRTYAHTILVRTKADLLPDRDSHPDIIFISAKTGTGLATLKSVIKYAIDQKIGSGTSLMPARSRHKKRLEETLDYVREALKSEGAELAIRSEYLRLAATSLGRITGRVDVEDLLGVIFSEFCIGK